MTLLVSFVQWISKDPNVPQEKNHKRFERILIYNEKGQNSNFTIYYLYRSTYGKGFVCYQFFFVCMCFSVFLFFSNVYFLCRQKQHLGRFSFTPKQWYHSEGFGGRLEPSEVIYIKFLLLQELISPFFNHISTHFQELYFSYVNLQIVNTYLLVYGLQKFAYLCVVDCDIKVAC